MRCDEFQIRLLLVVCVLEAVASDWVVTSQLALNSDYVSRGVSQSDGHMAIQGSYELSAKDGWYTKLWASSIHQKDNSESGVAVDVTGGYRGYLTKGKAYDIRVVQYLFPGAARSLHYDYQELIGTISQTFTQTAITLSHYYSPDNTANSGAAHYTRLQVDMPINRGQWYAKAGLGHQVVHNNAAFASPDYSDWFLTVSYPTAAATLHLTYADSTLSAQDHPGSGVRLVLTLSSSQRHI